MQHGEDLHVLNLVAGNVSSARVYDSEALAHWAGRDLSPGERVTVTARSIGPEVERLEIRTADGVLAAGPPTELTCELVVGDPTYVVALAVGGPHERAFTGGAYAHTSPVYLDVAGRHVAREQDVRWCLEWLDGMETLLRSQGTFETAGQLGDHLELIGRAREVYRARLG
ncbi:hypothetical protein ACFV0L_02165 [Streptosporangium canum]|uniref:hypothetical protein n=1 Tax=Streptosporangium canum TaxID=324952 RepID=UPI0036C1ED4A